MEFGPNLWVPFREFFGRYGYLNCTEMGPGRPQIGFENWLIHPRRFMSAIRVLLNERTTEPKKTVLQDFFNKFIRQSCKFSVLDLTCSLKYHFRKSKR